jgi:hypothetical protein
MEVLGGRKNKMSGLWIHISDDGPAAASHANQPCVVTGLHIAIALLNSFIKTNLRLQLYLTLQNLPKLEWMINLRPHMHWHIRNCNKFSDALNKDYIFNTAWKKSKQKHFRPPYKKKERPVWRPPPSVLLPSPHPSVRPCVCALARPSALLSVCLWPIINS